MNIELENGVMIFNVEQCGWGCSIDDIQGFRKLQGGLNDVLFLLKNNKNLMKFEIDIAVSSNKSIIPSSIWIPIETILFITNNDGLVIYNKYVNNSL